MSAFEYVFAFYSLILGLAAAEVVSGFADMWRDRRRIEVGFCTPVLAASVLLGVMNTWITFWAYREILAVGAEFMLVTALTALPYVVVSTVMFPEDADSHASLDAFYLSHARLVMVAMMIPTSAGMVGGLILGEGYWAGELIERFVVVYLVPLVLIFWRNLWAHRVGLALALAMMVWWLYR